LLLSGYRLGDRERYNLFLSQTGKRGRMAAPTSANLGLRIR